MCAEQSEVSENASGSIKASEIVSVSFVNDSNKLSTTAEFKQRIRVRKVNNYGNIVPGATFTVYGEDGNVAEWTELKADTYTEYAIVETATVSGYDLMSEPIYETKTYENPDYYETVVTGQKCSVCGATK